MEPYSSFTPPQGRHRSDRALYLFLAILALLGGILSVIWYAPPARSLTCPLDAAAHLATHINLFGRNL